METSEKYYDVVIIGAGPAGISCATVLAENSDLKILLLDQKKVIGPKVCAGGLTRKDLEHFNIPAEYLDHSFKEISVHTPRASAIGKDTTTLIATIDRKTLASWQLKRLANKANVEIKTDCKVTHISGSKVTINDSVRVRYGDLVGADGSLSRVRTFLALRTERIATAIQYIIPTTKYEKMEVFFDSRLFSAWYAWIFPHKDYVSIGCMCDPRHLSKKKLQANFHEWLQQNNIDTENATYRGYVINYDYRGYRFGNIFLAGDAAGLGSGLTGEGIYAAVISGEEVARTIMDEHYAAPQIAELLRIKEIQNKVIDTLVRIGPLRNIVYAALAPSIKNRKLATYMISYLF